jgi:hypothetical protein
VTDPNQLPDDPLSQKILKAIDELPQPEPSPSFDVKMRARLDELDARRPWWQRIGDLFTVQRVSLGAAACAVALFLFIIFAGPRHEASEIAQSDGLELAEDLELFENYEVIDNLDVLDDLELIEQLDDAG